MRFTAPSNDNTPLTDSAGGTSYFWKIWFRTVAQWLTEASRTNVSGELSWCQQGQTVFIDWTGNVGSAPLGFAKGSIPPPLKSTYLQRNDGTFQQVDPTDTAIPFTMKTKGWYFAQESK